MASRRISSVLQHVAATAAPEPRGGGVAPHPTAAGAAMGSRSGSQTPTTTATQPAAVPKTFRYTLPNSVLTQEERAFYEENGFIVIKHLFDDAQIDGYARKFKELCEQPKSRPLTMTVMRDVALAKKHVTENSENVITKVQDFQDCPELMAYCQDPKVLKYVEAFLGPRIVASHTMLINKPTDPGQGTSRHPLHQDMLYFPVDKRDRIVAAWTAMEKVTRDNGCLIAVPGSHKVDEILEHGYPDWEGGANKAYVGIMGLGDFKYVHLPMEKGDTVFFHPLLWHGSGTNRTPKFRKAICCHYFSGDCRFVDVRGTIQEPLEAEIKEMAKAKFSKRGQELSEETLQAFRMSDVWAMKSRVVQGDQFILPLEE